MAIVRTPIINDDGSGHYGTGLDYLWKEELYDQIDDALARATSVVNIADHGGVPDGVTPNDAAVAAAIAELTATSPGGGVLLFGPGDWAFSATWSITDPFITVRGSGRMATRLVSASTVAGIAISGDHARLEDLSLQVTGAGGTALYLSNGTDDAAQALKKPVLRNLKITGAAGTAHGIWVVNAQHGRIDDVYMPGGGDAGHAVLAESIGFWTVTDLDVTPNLNDGVVAWGNGVTVTVQAANLTFACDDNKFYNLRAEGTSGHGFRSYGTILSGPAVGIAPTDNSIYGGTFEGNAVNVQLDNAWQLSLHGCHWETSTVSPARELELNGDGCWNVGLYHCLGSVAIYEPTGPTNVKNTLLMGHSGDIYIAGPKVLNTTIINPNETGVLTDLGTWTTLIGRMKNPAGKTTGFSAGPTTLSANSVNGSGGAFVTICALPTTGFGNIKVFVQQNGTTNLGLYEIGYVNATGIGICSDGGGTTPVVMAIAGATTGQLTFQLSGSNLQAKGANATAPDFVYVQVENYQVPI